MKFLTGVFFTAVACALHAEDPRITPAVKIIEEIQPAILPIFSLSETGASSGAGILIHKDGYILTADHVIQDRDGFVIFDLKRVPYRRIGRLPEKDLAILKADLPREVGPIRVGRSHDLRTGEPIIVGGNPGGRGLVISQGTVNSPSIDPSWPNLLAKTYFRDAALADSIAKAEFPSTGGRPEFIQFDAMSNPGSSGGPLLNFRGELIGMVVSGSKEENSVNWAIPIDRMRLWFPYFIQPEETGGFWTGISVHLLADGARVVAVAPSSPAAQAGIQAGDTIQTMDGTPLRSGLDWHLNLLERKKAATIKLTLDRQMLKLEKELTLGDYPTLASTQDGKRPGLSYSVYRGQARLPERFTDLSPSERGELQEISVDKVRDREKESFAVVFEGYAEFPKAGLYRLWLGADDGAQLFLDNRLLIDNGLNHPYQELSRTALVPKGLVPVRVEYFQGKGQAQLSLNVRPESAAATDPPLKIKFWRDAESAR